MSTVPHHVSRVSRPVKKLEKPRPLKIPATNRHSLIDSRGGTVEEIMALADSVAMNLSNGNYDSNLHNNISSLNNMFKAYGQKLEIIYKDQLDRVFVTFRNGSRDERLGYTSRLCLLELIELRAAQWSTNDKNSFYKHKYNDVDLIPLTPVDTPVANALYQPHAAPVSPVTVPQQLLLGPGELVKSSGKFAAPTKIPGKNYCKDEVVIRNSDSGKVMGIKGRRVHMIEELSETVISFQRVSPGARERLVQITGPAEDKINYAKQLMEDTIRRNASPVRADLPDKERLGSSSSLNSSTSDDSLRYQNIGQKRATLLHSFSTNDATLGEYKYTVTVGDDSIKITGTNLDLVRVAKLVLDEYFSPDSAEQLTEYGYEEEGDMFVPASAELSLVNSQDSEESEDTYKGGAPLSKSVSFKTKTGPVKLHVIQTTAADSNQVAAEKDVEPVEKQLYFSVINSPTLTPDEIKCLNESYEGSEKRRGVTRFNNPTVNTPVTTTPTTTAPTVPFFLSYTSEELVELASSPLSRKQPNDWSRVMKEFPLIVKKAQSDYFDAKIYATRRPQESDAVNAIQSLIESGSPDIE